jgi:hypothetical protein
MVIASRQLTSSAKSDMQNNIRKQLMQIALVTPNPAPLAAAGVRGTQQRHKVAN